MPGSKRTAAADTKMHSPKHVDTVSYIDTILY